MISWDKPVCTKHGTPRVGKYLGTCEIHNEVHRVEIASPSTERGSPSTVFRYYADGHTRGDGAPSDNDLVNYDPADNRCRIPAPTR